MTLHTQIRQAMVMAAGLGTRLRPLTLDTPKPLLPISDTKICCLSLALNHLHHLAFDRIVVNAYYLPEAIEAYVRAHYPNVIISRETEPLETGGGILHALRHFEENAPLLIINGDTYVSNLSNTFGLDMLAHFNFETDDVLLGVSLKEKGIGFLGAGDYELNDRTLSYRPNGISAPYVFMGYRVLMPTFMRQSGEEIRAIKGNKFSLKDCFDIAESNGRLAGLCFDGTWCDLSTVETLNALKSHINALRS
ncbi:MAG: sugar phosphate nucleotidyltransferase [Candidatus Paracaedibacteraceae bacterium]|nr:sugar phosphate nucleotidyltransferase [Candidatus Paracaedibacteraceae bacterium]